jgi:UDP-N-acetyl-D-glucosamine dehydrogenase
MNLSQTLQKKIQQKKATVAVVGLGYVGLPLSLEFAKVGFSVLGIDSDHAKLNLLKKGKSYLTDLPSDSLREYAVKKKKISFSAQYSVLSKADAVLICVPTPLGKMRDPDLSFVIEATKSVSEHLKKGQLVVLESTTYPGTTVELIAPLLEKSGLKIGKDFFLCFSPERVDPGNQRFGPADIPKVVGGVTTACTKIGSLLYSQVTPKVVSVSNPTVAEMAKLIENSFRIVNIAFINELAMVSEKMGIDIWEAIDAASSKPFGFMPFYPGPGIGGHCIGIDPLYLSWKAKMYGEEIQFINLASKTNSEMPHYVMSRISRALNKVGKAVKEAEILVVGVAYKKNINDIRESPSLEVLTHLHSLGAGVQYVDPYVPQLEVNGHSYHSVSLKSVKWSKYDLVLILTDHSNLPYRDMVRKAKLIFDTRNVLARNGLSAKNVIKL